MSSDRTKLRVLLIDDCPEDRETYRRLLADGVSYDYEFLEAETAEEGLALCRSEEPDCILLDYRLPDLDGLELLAQLSDEPAERPSAVVMLTGEGDEQVAVEAMKRGAEDYLVKRALPRDALDKTIRHAVGHRQAAQERRQLLDDLRMGKELLERKNKRLAELYNTAHQFVDNVSHEFRTPLTVIKEFVSIVRDGLAGPVAPEQIEYLDIVANRVDDLTLMVNDMLDISRLDAGLLPVSRGTARIEEIVEHVRTTLERKAAVNKVDLQIDVDPALPPIYCDSEKIGRVIINLAANALKFTGEGGHVRLWVRRAGHLDICVGLTDDGPGIDADHLESIFRRFSQINDGARSSTKGFGLGLSIANELVELNFGKMHVESELGRGSTFSFNIPLAEPDEILRRYVDRMSSRGPSHAALLAAHIRGPQNNDVLNQIDEFLSHLGHANDLLFRAGQARWLIVIGCVPPELPAAIRRIEDAWRLENRNRPVGPLPKIDFELQGSWPMQRAFESILEHFQTELSKAEEIHA